MQYRICWRHHAGIAQWQRNGFEVDFMTKSEAGKLGYAASLLNKLHMERNKLLRQGYEQNPKKCPSCGNAIPYEKRRNNCCSHKCAAVRREESICQLCPTLISGKYLRCAKCNPYRRKTDIFSAKTDRVRKRILIELRGNTCEGCLLSFWREDPIPLELDHIDGNSDHNEGTNLRLLCPNCHAQTPTYKGRNKGTKSKRALLRRNIYVKGISSP